MSRDSGRGGGWMLWEVGSPGLALGVSTSVCVCVCLMTWWWVSPLSSSGCFRWRTGHVPGQGDRVGSKEERGGEVAYRAFTWARIRRGCLSWYPAGW